MKEAKKPLILLSNDDGFDATGIGALIKILRPIGDIIVVAPEGGRSGSSLSITGTVPVKYNKEYEEEGGKERSDFGSLTVYSCSGTPCDCVKMALEFLMPRRPDIVIGGINHGDNAATNAHYSGTIGIAIEGEANIQMVLPHQFLEVFDMGGTIILVGIESIGAIPDDIEFCA